MALTVQLALLNHSGRQSKAPFFFHFVGYFSFGFPCFGCCHPEYLDTFSYWKQRTVHLFEMCTFNLVALRWAASRSSSSGGEPASLSEVSGISAVCAFLYCKSVFIMHYYYIIYQRFTSMLLIVFLSAREWLKS